MRIADKGHKYELTQLFKSVDGSLRYAGDKQILQFLNTEKGRECAGVTTQEVIRALIDRTWYCNDCLPWSGNKLIVDHLRMALALHEARHLIRGVEKGEIEPERIMVGTGGHFIFCEHPDPSSDYARMPDTGTETGSLNPGVCSHLPKHDRYKLEKESKLRSVFDE